MTNNELKALLDEKREGMTHNERCDFDMELRGLLHQHPDITNQEVWDAIKRDEAIAAHYAKCMVYWIQNGSKTNVLGN